MEIIQCFLFTFFLFVLGTMFGGLYLIESILSFLG
tara:strand:+ start:169 stop:273 length:105 start_codon:yes stop_codon:yes gene_type:complete